MAETRGATAAVTAAAAVPVVDLTMGATVAPDANGVGAPLPPRGPRVVSLDPSVTVHECLQHFTALESLSEQVYCEACKEPRPAKKRLSVSASPRVLVLHFKRFDSLRQLKLCTKVEFPVRGLDLTPFMHHDTPHAETGRDGSIGSSDGASDKPRYPCGPTDTPYLYDLQGVINHKGSLTQVGQTVNGKNQDSPILTHILPPAAYTLSYAAQGHYVAYVASINGGGHELQSDSTVWLRCDDETVTPVSEDDVANVEG